MKDASFLRYREHGQVVRRVLDFMEVQLGGPNQSPPGALIVVGIVVFLLGCIWPFIVLGDFTDELEAQSWETIDARVIELEIEEENYECGDTESSSTCTDYYVNYLLRYVIDEQAYSASGYEKVSHFESRVWEVDYPKNSTIEIAYDPEDPNNIDIDQGNFAPFIPPAFVALFCTLIAALFVIGGVRGILNPTEPVNPDEKSDIPYSDEPVHFESAKNIWSELHFAHPSVEALAKKMKLYSCTDAQIDEFFTICKKQNQDKNNPTPLDRDWLVEIEEMVESHDSEESQDLAGQMTKAGIVVAGIGVVLLVLSFIIVLPLFRTYGALPWYGWALSIGALGSIGICFALAKIVSEMKKFADQGLGELLLEFANEELDGYHED